MLKILTAITAVRSSWSSPGSRGAWRVRDRVRRCRLKEISTLPLPVSWQPTTRQRRRLRPRCRRRRPATRCCRPSTAVSSTRRSVSSHLLLVLVNNLHASFFDTRYGVNLIWSKTWSRTCAEGPNYAAPIL